MFLYFNRIASFVIYAFICIVLSYVIEEFLNMNPLEGWILTINLVTFVVCGKDKLRAILGGRFGRTPETTLLALGFFGGFPALFLGRKLFNHKTTKKEFIVPMYSLLALQIILVAYYIYSYGLPQ